MVAVYMYIYTMCTVHCTLYSSFRRCVCVYVRECVGLSCRDEVMRWCAHAWLRVGMSRFGIRDGSVGSLVMFSFRRV